MVESLCVCGQSVLGHGCEAGEGAHGVGKRWCARRRSPPSNRLELGFQLHPARDAQNVEDGRDIDFLRGRPPTFWAPWPHPA